MDQEGGVMKKRETRQQREDRERAALLQRIVDIYSGASGYHGFRADKFWEVSDE